MVLTLGSESVQADMTSTEFSAETSIGARRGAGDAGISLADLQSRRVPLDWFEAVAIVQESCRVLLESRVDPDKASLRPKNVSIDSAGSVRITQNAGEKGEPAMRQIGELLRTSLAASPFPVQLRLVITQACSTVPVYASIAALSSALEYFERPDRPGLIRAVYERAQGYQTVSGDVTEDAPEPEAEKPANQDKRQPRSIPRSVLAASAVTATLLVIWLVISQLQIRQLGDGSVAEIVSSVAALVDRANPFTASSSPEAETPAAQSLRTIDASPRRNSATAGGGATRSSPQAVLPAALPETPQAADASAGDALPTSDATDTNTVGAFATAEAVDAVAEAMIYSANDQDVISPAAAYPRLPAQPPTGIPAGEFCRVDLIVSEDGTVESVRLVGASCTVRESMFLSAAKAWQFQPELKDGVPARYSKTIWLAH
jgi:hypothetical protein